LIRLPASDNPENDGRGMPPAGRRAAVRMDEVAALTGVSIATVSRALANPGRVSPATRERVLEAVRRTGYTPNLAARSLRAARSMTVLVVVPSLITPFFSHLLLGVDQALSAEGFGLLIGNLHDGAGKEARLVDLVLAGQADGVLLLNGEVIRGRVHSIADRNVPMVAVTRPIAGGIPAVLVRDRQASAVVARHLLDLGHRTFGYVTGPLDNPIEHERWAGYSGALAAAGIAPSAIVRIPGDFHVASGIAAGQRFLELARRPTAVFAVSDMMAIGFMKAVHEGGLVVPRDVSVVGFDGIEFADHCAPPLTTVRQPREAMGRAAAALLIRLIRGESIPEAERTLLLDAPLRPAGSTGPAPGARVPPSL
jgi:LacI family repressor for deo operon, udp, cdd, tsx, nupC, and nupG